jgi:hypothetical protein
VSSVGGPGRPRRPQRFGTSAATFALGLALSLVLLVAVGTSVVEAQTGDISGADPTLDLDPSSGPPGTSVTAVVTGFEACVALESEGEVQRPEETSILWDGTDPVGQIEVDLVTGRGETSFPVPTGAPLGEYTVVARCVIDGASTSFRADDRFVVEPSVEVRAVVPDVVGASREEAVAAIRDADLEVGQVIGDGEVVRTQDPPAGTEVDPGTPVDIDLGVAPPGGQLPVPDVPDVPDMPDVPDVPAGPDADPDLAVVPTVASVDPWTALLVAVVGLLVAVWIARHLLRARRDRRGVRRHVRVERGPTTSSHPVVHEDGDGGPTHVVRLEPRLDSRPPTLEEVVP